MNLRDKFYADYLNLSGADRESFVELAWWILMQDVSQKRTPHAPPQTSDSLGQPPYHSCPLIWKQQERARVN